MSTTICKVCGCKILDTPVVICKACDTPHHADCWQYNAGCSVFACNPATQAVIIPKGGPQDSGHERPGSRPNLVAATVMMLLLCLFMVRIHRASVNTLHGAGCCVPSPPYGAFEGFRAPDFLATRMEGGQTTLGEVRRGRVTVLTFWLARCPDCMPFIPDWNPIYQHLHESDDLALINVAAYAGPAQQAFIQRFCEESHIGGQVLLDAQNRAVPAYKLGTITTFVIDRDGIIRYRGSQGGTAADKVEPIVNQVLNQDRN